MLVYFTLIIKAVIRLINATCFEFLLLVMVGLEVSALKLIHEHTLSKK